MKIRDVMTPNPKTVSPNDTVQAAAQVMQAEDTGAVPVVQNGQVLAVAEHEIGARRMQRLEPVGGIEIAVPAAADCWWASDPFGISFIVDAERNRVCSHRHHDTIPSRWISE